MKNEKRNWLIKKRLNKGLDQQDVAELIGVTQQFYNYIENGKRRPSPEIAMKIAKVFDFDWKVFYEKTKYSKKVQSIEQEE